MKWGTIQDVLPVLYFVLTLAGCEMRIHSETPRHRLRGMRLIETGALCLTLWAVVK